MYRITLTARAFNATAVVAFLESDADKAKVLERVLHGSREPFLLPAQLINPDTGEIYWLLDQAAGSSL